MAFGNLIDSLNCAKPAPERPALDDPAVGDAYNVANETRRKYGPFWYDPPQLQTVATARAFASMAAQQRYNILFVNASAVTAVTMLAVLLPYNVGPLLVIRAAVAIASSAVAILAGERLRELKELHNQYMARIADLDE